MTTEPADPPRPSHATAPNQFVTANGVRYAYRRFGAEAGTPVVFLQHFRGGMDNWDPAVTDGLAANRPVILFNNTGVASSSGQTPDTVEAQADDAAAFIRALGLTHVDVLGFSIGGYVAQALTLRHRDPPRKYRMDLHKGLVVPLRIIHDLIPDACVRRGRGSWAVPA